MRNSWNGSAVVLMEPPQSGAQERADTPKGKRSRPCQQYGVRPVNLPRKGRKKRAYLSSSQVELLARQCGEFGTLVHTLAYTGLRWGEAIGLRVSSLDMLRRRMLVEENAVHVGHTVIVGTPKSHENRSVPFPRFLSDPLAQACNGKARDQLVFGAGSFHLRKTSSDTGWFVRAVRRCQEIDGTFPFITPHDLRHTAASLAIGAEKVVGFWGAKPRPSSVGPLIAGNSGLFPGS